MVGTPAYMAPEQVAGQRDQVTEAADIYGLGATLYCLLVGEPPFRRDTDWETLQAVQQEEAVAPGRRVDATSPRPRRNLPEVSAEESSPPLSFGGRVGARFAAVSGRRTDFGSPVERFPTRGHAGHVAIRRWRPAWVCWRSC